MEQRQTARSRHQAKKNNEIMQIVSNRLFPSYAIIERRIIIQRI